MRLGQALPYFLGEFVKSLLSLKNQFSGISQESVQNLWVLTALLLICSVTLGESLQGLRWDQSCCCLQSRQAGQSGRTVDVSGTGRCTCLPADCF